MVPYDWAMISGYDIHSSPWFVDGPNRNRWFTELNSMVIFHGELLVITRWYLILTHSHIKKTHAIDFAGFGIVWLCSKQHGNSPALIPDDYRHWGCHWAGVKPRTTCNTWICVLVTKLVITRKHITT